MTERKMPIKTATIALNGDWLGWEFTARTNPPLKLFGDLASGEFDRIIASLAKVLISWNFVDEEGLPLGEPNEDTVGELPVDFAEKLLDPLEMKISAKIKPISPSGLILWDVSFPDDIIFTECEKSITKIKILLRNRINNLTLKKNLYKSLEYSF